MKKKSSFWKALTLALVLGLSTGSVTVQAAETTEGKTAVSRAVKKGLVKKKGKYYYYLTAKKKAKNTWKVIKKKSYYFGGDGAAKTGWYTARKNGKFKTYYFNSKGVMVPQKTKSVDQSLVKKMDQIIKAGAGKSTGEKALKKLFAYVTKTYGYERVIGFEPTKGWDVRYAKEMFTKKKGSCYHDAAAFAYLAKRASGYPVRICVGESNAFREDRWQPHAWCEIKIGKTWYTYDTNANRFSSLRKGKWYRQKSSSLKNKVYKTEKTFEVEI